MADAPAASLDGRTLTPRAVAAVARDGARAVLTPAAAARNRDAHATATAILAAGGRMYGASTGVGALLDEATAPDGEHALRLLRSHTGGTGPVLAPDLARAMLVVRANQLGAGGGGVTPELLDAMVQALNAGLAPAVRGSGGIGTGDLTALAEAGLALVGEGRWLGEATPPAPVALGARDGLALMSSNAATIGVAALGCVDAELLCESTEAVAAVSLEAVDGDAAAFDERLHAGRPHDGQVAAAANLRGLLAGAARQPARLQDPLAFRCAAQVAGAARDAVADLGRVLGVELNAAAENPLVIAGDGRVLHGGNFDTTRLAVTLDALRASLLRAATLSAERLAALVDPRWSGLAPFLAGAPGRSGVIILEYTAAAALADLRAAAAPVTLANAVLAHGIENSAPFTATAARQLTAGLASAAIVIGAELVAAVRALQLRGATPAGRGAAAVFERAAAVLDADVEDRPLTGDVEAAAALVAGGGLC